MRRRRALRLFVADELLEAITPATLMKAHGFDPAFLKFTPDQPRVPAGNGQESGRWTSDGATNPAAVTPVSFRTRGKLKALSSFLEWLRSQLKDPKHESLPERAPPGAPPNSVEFDDLQLPKIDSNKSHHIFDDPRHRLDDLVTEFGSQEDPFKAVASATRDAVKAQGVTGKFEIQVEVSGHQVTVRGPVVDGVVNIGTVFIPWKR